MRAIDSPVIVSFTATCEMCGNVKSIGQLRDLRICKPCDDRRIAAIQDRHLMRATQGGLL